jgi:hypothetical protein
MRLVDRPRPTVRADAIARVPCEAAKLRAYQGTIAALRSI